MIAGTLQIQMMADVARIADDMHKVRGHVTNAMEGIEKSVELAKTALEALGIGLGLGELIEKARAILEVGEAMDNLSQRVGIAVGELAKYELATKQTGTNMEALSKGVKGISVNLLEHGDALKKAGLSATTADGAILQLADLFRSMPDGMEKTSLAVKLFGKSGMDLIPMLNLGSEGLKEAADKSEKYAAAMTLLAPNAKVFNDSMVELGMYSHIAGMSLMNDMLPGLIAVAKATSQAAQEGGMFKAAFAGLNELAWESWGRSLEILRLKANAWFAEIEAKKQRFFWGDNAAAGNYQNQANEAYLRIQQLSASAPKAAAAAATPSAPNFDTKKWMADYKAMMAAIGIGGGTTAVDPYIKLQEAAAKYLDSLKKEQAQLGMTDVEKKLYDENVIALTLHKGAERDAFMASTTAVIKEVDAYKKAAEAKKVLEKADLDAATARDKYNVSLIDGLDKMQADTLALKEQYDRIGLTKEAIASLDAAKIESKAVTLDLLAIKTLDKNLDETQYNILKAQAKELRDQAGLQGLIAGKDTANTFAQTLHDDVKNALSTAFRDTKDPIAAFGDALGNVIFTRVTNSLADALATQLLNSSAANAVGSFFGLSFAGGISTAVSAATGSTPFAADYSLGSGSAGLGLKLGGSFASGIDYVPNDMIAQIHKGERIVPAAQNNSSGQPNITININATVGDIASKSDVVAGMRATANQITSSLMRSGQYGGAMIQ